MKQVKINKINIMYKMKYIKQCYQSNRLTLHLLKDQSKTRHSYHKSYLSSNRLLLPRKFHLVILKNPNHLLAQNTIMKLINIVLITVAVSLLLYRRG